MLITNIMTRSNYNNMLERKGYSCLTILNKDIREAEETEILELIFRFNDEKDLIVVISLGDVEVIYVDALKNMVKYIHSAIMTLSEFNRMKENRPCSFIKFFNGDVRKYSKESIHRNMLEISSRLDLVLVVFKRSNEIFEDCSFSEKLRKYRNELIELGHKKFELTKEYDGGCDECGLYEFGEEACKGCPVEVIESEMIDLGNELMY